MQESGDRSQESAERLAERVKQLRACLDVYDATLRVLGLALHRNDIELLDFEQRQVDTAQNAYREVTGDEPLSLAPMLYCEKERAADDADALAGLESPLALLLVDCPAPWDSVVIIDGPPGEAQVEIRDADGDCCHIGDDIGWSTAICQAVNRAACELAARHVWPGLTTEEPC